MKIPRFILSWMLLGHGTLWHLFLGLLDWYTVLACGSRTGSGVWDLASNFVIGWSKCRLRLPSAPLHYELTWPVGIPTVFQTPWQSLCTALRGLWNSLWGNCPGIPFQVVQSLQLIWRWTPIADIYSIYCTLSLNKLLRRLPGQHVIFSLLIG